MDANSFSVREFIARVVEEQRGSYRLLSEDTEYIAVLAGRRQAGRDSHGLLSDDAESLTELAGRLRHQTGPRVDLPVVGDWVRAVAGAAGTGRAVIREVLPRRSRLSRHVAGNPTEEQVLAANVDIVFIVSSLNRDLSPDRLGRYVTLARNCGVTPVILLNKADLCTDPHAALTAVAAAMPGVPVHAMSALQGRGFEALAPYLSPGTTCVLLGSSGVGKSTIVNGLLGTEAQRVAPARKRDDRGRHTTTHRQLLRLPGGALLIDTPGLREIQLWNDDHDAGLEHAFADITKLATACRFTDCEHQSEPGCAVKAAVAAGTLAAGRLRSYAKLQRELAFLERKQDTRSRSDHKKRHRAMNLVKRTRRVR
jgi:ribosome biogenesis GTPase / thiamine phosphate phosphatase